MKVDEKIIAEDGEKIVKHVTYRRAGTKLLIHNLDELLRQIAFVLRHTQHPIKRLLVEQGKDIEYTQEVVELKEKKNAAQGSGQENVKSPG